jgi:hypothetical protein
VVVRTSEVRYHSAARFEAQIMGSEVIIGIVSFALIAVAIVNAYRVLRLDKVVGSPARHWTFFASFCEDLAERLGWTLDRNASRPGSAHGSFAGGTLSIWDRSTPGCSGQQSLTQIRGGTLSIWDGSTSGCRFQFRHSLPPADRGIWRTLLDPPEMAAAIAVLTKKTGKAPWAGGPSECEFNVDQILVEGELPASLPPAADVAEGLSALADTARVEALVHDFLQPAVDRIDNTGMDWLRVEVLYALHIADNTQARIAVSLVRAIITCEAQCFPDVRGVEPANRHVRVLAFDWLRHSLRDEGVAIEVREAAFDLLGALLDLDHPFRSCVVDRGRQLWRPCSLRSRDAAMGVAFDLLADQQDGPAGRAALEDLVRDSKAESERRRGAFLILAGLLLPSPGGISDHPIIAYAWQCGQSELQEAAFQVIERFADDATLTGLIPSLEHVELTIWERFLRLIQDKHPADAEAHVLELLRSRHPYLRRLAIQTLGEIGSAASIDPLWACLGDRPLLKAARASLRTLHTRLGLPDPEQDPASVGRVSLADGDGRVSLADDLGRLSVPDPDDSV